MADFIITVRQKSKTSVPLSNLRDETNFMYNNTIGISSRDDLGFYILLFFLSFKKGSNSYLYSLIKENLPKLFKFSKEMSSKGEYLEKDEYAKLKVKHGLEKVLRLDILFLILEIFSRIDVIKIKFSSFLKKDKSLSREIDKIEDEFSAKILEFYDNFVKNKIRDDRYDENWEEWHDLSKSVYKTVNMRLIRKLDLSLQKETELIQIQRNSPLVLEIIQSIDANLLYDLWNSFHLTQYFADLFKNQIEFYNFIESNISFEINAWSAVPFVLQKTSSSFKKKNQKKIGDLKKAKSVEEDELLSVLINSMFNSQQKLDERIKILNKKIEEMNDAPKLDKTEEKIKKALIKEMNRLLNLEITIEKKPVNTDD